MNLSVFFAFLSILFLSAKVSAQSLYGITSEKDLVRIFPSGCTSEVVLNGTDMNPEPGSLWDITYEQGVLYGTQSSGICTINPVDGHVAWVDMGTAFDANGLTGDHNGTLYLAGSDVARFNTSSEVFELLGSLYPYHTSGDLEYVDGSLYITAADSLGAGYLLKAETNPFSYTVVGSIPSDCYGLTSSMDLDSEHLYISSFTTLYLLDINDASTAPVCSPVSEISGIYGLTYTRDHLSLEDLHPGDIQISQDMISETLSITTRDKKISEFTIYNELGQKIAGNKLTDELTIINTSNYSAGVYLIRFMNNKGVVVDQVKIVCL